MYRKNDKICDLMVSEHGALQVISRFELPLGVGDKTIQQVCLENNIDCYTFLCVINYATGGTSQQDIDYAFDVDIPTLMIYLKNAHRYFLDYQLPRIRQELIEAISAVKTNSRIPLLIIRFYDEYVEEVKMHIKHENENAFQLHKDDDEHIASKLKELKNLIIKYYPGEQNPLLYSTLQDIFAIEAELALHCSIEDHILLPTLQAQEADRLSGEDLSKREKDVLIQVVHGLSNKEIAEKLCISTHTVMSHRKNIARKLNIHSVAGLTIYAIVNKLICLDELKNI